MSCSISELEEVAYSINAVSGILSSLASSVRELEVEEDSLYFLSQTLKEKSDTIFKV